MPWDWQAWRALGDVAQLPAWSAVLARLGDEYESGREQGCEMIPSGRSSGGDAAALAGRFPSHCDQGCVSRSLFPRIEATTRPLQCARRLVESVGGMSHFPLCWTPFSAAGAKR